jgi:3-oxoacyl-[acyl-carrier-protein] synthase II
MTENKNRCVVTGLGMITSIGDNVNDCFANAIKGVSGTKEITSVPTEGCYAKKASEIHTDLSDIAPGENLDRATKLCIHAAKEALKDAGLAQFEDSSRVSLIIGNCVAGVDAIEDYYTNGKKTEDILQMPMSCIGSQVARYVHAGGTVTTIANACAAGTMSISYATDLIRDGRADIVICGGTDAFASVPYAGFLALHAMDPEQCSSFNHTTGINLGEGSGILIVESYEHALKRKAHMYCEVLGSGVSTDAHHITAPREDGEGQMNAINWAIRNSGIKPTEVGYVNAHGTGTHKNDYAEFLSLKTIFGADNDQLCVSSTKPMVGHCLGAAGSIEAIFCIKALNQGIIPPTLGFSEEDMPQLKENAGDIDFVPNVAKKKELHYVMNNSFAFGGNNASIIFADNEGNVETKKNEDELVITGYGIVTPLGNGFDSYVEAIKNGAKVESSDVHSVISKDDFAKIGIPMSIYRKWDTVSQLETFSGVEALKNAGITITDENATKIGIVDGTSEGAMGMGCLFEENLAEKGNAAGSAFKFPNTVYNAAAGYLSIYTGIKGYNVTICNGPQSGLAAVGYAMNILQNEKEEMVLVSGSDENIDVTSQLYHQLGFVADSYVEPYSHSKGTVLSDGASSLIMESKKHALDRGAKVYCKVTGYSTHNEPVEFGKVTGSSAALKKAIEEALAQAGLTLNDISAISGFGNGMKAVDELEIETYQEIFQDKLESLPVISSKKRIGEARANSALLSLVDASLLLSDTITEDKDCYLIKKNGVAQTSVQSKDMKNILVTAFATGGSFTAVVVTRN